MHFTRRNVLYGALTGLVGAIGVRADSCSDGPFEESSAGMVFGAKGYDPSTPFCQSLWNNGLVVTGIEVWATPYHVAGVQFTYSDGSTQPVQGNTVYGSNKAGNDMKNDKNYRHDHLTWNVGDKVTMMEAATSKDGKALGYLHIEVAGQKLEVGSDGTQAKQSINVGAGLLLGASGETNAFPSAWTPLFMGTNDGSASITDMKFDDDLDDINKKQAGISAVTLSEVYIKNTNVAGANNSAQSWTFTGSTTKGTSTSTSTTKTNSFSLSESIEIGAKFGIPLIGDTEIKSTTTAAYSYTTATDKTTGSTDTQTFQWSSGSTVTSDLVQPGHAKHCKATTWEGDYKGGYTSTVTINVNGKSFSYQEKGVFQSISYTTAISECQDILIKDIPGGSQQIDAPSTQGKRAFIA